MMRVIVEYKQLNPDYGTDCYRCFDTECVTSDDWCMFQLGRVTFPESKSVVT